MEHTPLTLSSFYLYIQVGQDQRKNPDQHPRTVTFAMGDLGNFRFTAAISYNVFGLTGPEHSEKCLWSLPAKERSPEWRNIMERPVCWRWPALCHAEGRDWIGLVQGCYRTGDIWTHWVPDRWRNLYDYERSAYFLKTRAKPHETPVVLLVWFCAIRRVCLIPFSLLKATTFLQSQTVLEPQKTAVCFLKAFPLVGTYVMFTEKANIPPFIFIFILDTYSLPK